MLKAISKYGFDLDQQFLLFLAIVLATMLSIGQLTDPFVAHDDYDWLTGRSFDQGFASPWSKTFSEGRWINYLWSFISTKLTPYSAFAIFLFLYSCVSLLAANLITKKAGVLAATLIFFAPMGAAHMQWPATLICGYLIFCIVLILMNQTHSDSAKLIIMPFAVVAGFLTYPSFGPLLLILYGASFSGKIKYALWGLLIYIASFFTAIMIAFTLNYFFHGHFSIQPESWREATPLFSTGTLQTNVARYLIYYDSVKTLWPALLASAIGYGICFVKGVRVQQCAAVLLFGVGILGIEASLSIISGLELPVRATIWLWAVVCVPVIYLAYSDQFTIAGIGLSSALLLTGIVYWAGVFENIRSIYPTMRHLGHQIQQVQALNAGKFDSIVTYGDANANPGMKAIHSNRALRNFLFKEFNIYLRPCRVDFCQKIEATREHNPMACHFLLSIGSLSSFCRLHSGNPN